MTVVCLPENRIQTAVVARLRLAEASGKLVFFHIPNGSSLKGGAREGAARKRVGVRAGVPDLCIIAQGHVYFLELKTEKGKLSPSQRGMDMLLGAHGAKTAVAYGLDQAIDTLELWGLI